MRDRRSVHMRQFGTKPFGAQPRGPGTGQQTGASQTPGMRAQPFSHRSGITR